LSSEKIREDEEYFVRYFQNKTPRKKRVSKDIEGEGDEDEADAFADELFEEKMKALNPDDDDDLDDGKLWEFS
jgi:hypothetical protein